VRRRLSHAGATFFVAVLALEPAGMVAASVRQAGHPGTQWSVRGRTVTITVPVDLFGPAVVHDADGGLIPLDNLARRWKLAAERRWNEAFRSLRYYGDCAPGSSKGLSFRLKVEMNVFPSSFFLTQNQTGHHRVFVTDTPIFEGVYGGFRVPGQNGVYNDNDVGYSTALEGFFNPRMPAAGAAHELGHAMGLGDDYVWVTDADGKRRVVALARDAGGQALVDANGRPRPGLGSNRAGTLMSYAVDHKVGRIDPQLIDRLGRIVSNVTGKKPTCPQPSTNGRFRGVTSQQYAVKIKVKKGLIRRMEFALVLTCTDRQYKYEFPEPVEPDAVLHPNAAAGGSFAFELGTLSNGETTIKGHGKVGGTFVSPTEIRGTIEYQERRWNGSIGDTNHLADCLAMHDISGKGPQEVSFDATRRR
jgi:hypothetical protein